MTKDIYHKNGKQIIEYGFDSLFEYCDYLNAGVHNPKITSTTSKDSHRNDWSGTATYEEAVRLCLYGDYSNKFNELLKLKDTLNEEMTEK